MDILDTARAKRAERLAADAAGVPAWELDAQRNQVRLLNGPHVFVLTNWDDTYNPWTMSLHRTALGAYLAGEACGEDYVITISELED